MKKPPCEKDRFAEFQAAARLREGIRQDRAHDAQWRDEGERRCSRADRRAARIAGLVKTARARIEGCRDYPTPLAIRQVRALVDDPATPAQIRVQAAALLLQWSD